jgi:hypothetical protein
LILIDRYTPLPGDTAAAVPFPPAYYAKRPETVMSNANKNDIDLVIQPTSSMSKCLPLINACPCGAEANVASNLSV